MPWLASASSVFPALCEVLVENISNYLQNLKNISAYLQNLQNISDYLQNLQIIIKIFTISTINIVENLNIIGCLGNYIIGH